MTGTNSDITQDREVEQLIKNQLKEKQTLLQEIHHRVKNNLQVISSLLSFQQQRATEPEVVELFQQSRNRVAAIALVHERLYQSKNLNHIDFTDYVRDLTQTILLTFGSESSRIQTRIHGGGLRVGVQQAVPCALILNELFTNSLKFAFPEERSGNIQIDLTQDAANGQLRVRIADDGVGLPPEFCLATSKSLGLRLVHRLADQLQGTVEHVPTPSGTCFELKFENNLCP
jgi:two-component sensor histidine kinase